MDMLGKLCVQMINKQLQINIFHADFEKAAHNAVLQKFPNCKLVSYNFHLGQSWYRRIQQNKPLLNEYLNKSSEIGAWLKCFFGLSYLPPDEISDDYGLAINCTYYYVYRIHRLYSKKLYFA
jgi:hypothetical protein